MGVCPCVALPCRRGWRWCRSHTVPCDSAPRPAGPNLRCVSGAAALPLCAATCSLIHLVAVRCRASEPPAVARAGTGLSWRHLVLVCPWH